MDGLFAFIVIICCLYVLICLTEFCIVRSCPFVRSLLFFLVYFEFECIIVCMLSSHTIVFFFVLHKYCLCFVAELFDAASEF